MSLTTFAVRNYRFITVITMAALFLGAIGYMKMPRQEDPPLPAFGGVVTVLYPGATPEEVEDRILDPLEEAIHELEEIDRIEGIARDGLAVVTGEFREDVDRERAYDLFVQQVTAAREEFPGGVVEVETREIKPSSVVVIQAALHGRAADSRTLRVWAEELERRWRSLPDAKDVEVEGAQQQEVHVLVDPERLAAAGLTLGQLGQALAAANGDLPGGVVQSEGQRLTIRPNARFEEIDDVSETVVRTVDGRPVRIGDLARVEWGDEDPRYRTRFGGVPAVLVTLTLKDGRNVFPLAKAARGEIEELRRSLPGGIELSIALDQSEDVARRLGSFTASLLTGAGIIVVFVAILLGWRPAVVIITAMLTSVAIAFSLLEFRGTALQQMSIAGLVVVLGLLVDNAIVVVEGILQERQRGLDSVKAAIAGTDRVASAVASSTATTVAAFAPMLLMAGSVGDFTRDIPTVVVVVLIVSLAVALFLTPLVASRMFASDRALREPAASRFLHRVARDGAYRRTLDFLILRPKTTIAALLLLAGGTLALSPLVGFNFFPRAEDKPTFLVRIVAPQGTSLDELDAMVAGVEDEILEAGWARTVTANVGQGNPLIYYNHVREGARANFGELLVTVEPDEGGKIPDRARSLREKYAASPDFVLETKMLVQGPPVGLPVSIQIFGRDLDRLREHADVVAARLREIDGAINVTHELKPGPARLDLQIDPVKVGKLGLDTSFVAREIRFAMAGLPSTVLRQDDEDFDVVVRVAPEGRESIADLERVRIPVPGGAPVPLAQLTRPALSSTFAQIEHTDLSRSVIVGSDVDGRLAADIVAELLPTVQALPLNGQERFEVIGEDEERDRAFLSMLQNVVLALGLIYGILVLQFRSFATPMVIFTSIPVALAGSVIGLLLGGWPFGFTAFTGLLALVGIVVNDAIVLVDRVNQLRRAGASLPDAIREGGASRMQPIILTTLTTIAGLLPLTLTGGSMWGPMGWVIIGGLLAATTVTLVMVPAMYVLLERGRQADRPSGAPGPVAHAAVATSGVFLALALFVPVASAEAVTDTLEVDLGELTRLVDAANPDLAAARANVAAAEARIREAESARWPTLDLEADLSRTNDPARTFGLTLQSATGPADLAGFDPGAEVDVLGGSAGVQWLLFDFSRGPRVDAARLLAEASESDFAEVRASLHLAAAVELLTIERLVLEFEVTARALASIGRELADAEQRRRAGRGLAADVLGLAAREAELRTRRIAVAGAIGLAEARLSEILALDPSTVLRPAQGLSVRDAGFATVQDATNAALDAREERLAADARARAAEASIGAATGARWPSLVARGELNYVVPDVDFDDATDNYAVGIGLRWAPFQGGAVSARSDEARARHVAAEHAERSAALRVRRQVRDAWIQLETAVAGTASATLQREAAAESFRVVRLRFEEGRDSLARYLQAELALFEAESTLVQAHALEQSARAGLLRAVGEPIGGAAR